MMYTDKLARDLVRLLADLSGLYGQMALHMRHKLDAMKQADTDRVASLTAHEMALVEKVRQREGLRRQLTRRIVEALQIVVPQDRPLRLVELAEHLSEPARSQVLSVAAGLRERLGEIQKLQDTTKRITERMLEHIASVVEAMTSSVSGGETYARSGVTQPSRAPHIFEAVG
jgi:pyrroline-5-carboxylate reductase